MKITLKEVIPNPLKEVQHSEESIWGKTLVLEEGYSYLIKAPSGKGKTTLVSILFGIRRDYEGNVLFDQNNIDDQNINTWTNLRRDTLSIVFQGLKLFPKLTARENILIKNKLTHHKTDQEIEEMANALDVSNLLDRSASTLSFGQQQRIAMIRALCQPFKWLLLDEPFSHLDDQNIKKAHQLLDRECKKNNAGMILCSLDNPYYFNYHQTLTI